MFAGVDWSSIHVAGAFVLGAVVGGFAVLRVMRYLFNYLRRVDKDD